MCFCGNLFCRQTQVYGIHRRVRYKKMRWRVQLSTSRSDLPPTATGRVWIRRHRRYMGVRIGMNSLLWRIGVFGPSRRMRITRCLCKRSFSIDGERQGPDRDVAFPTFKFSILNKWDRRKYIFLIRRRCRLRAVSWMGKVWQPWQRSVHDTGTNHFQILLSLLDQNAHLPSSSMMLLALTSIIACTSAARGFQLRTGTVQAAICSSESDFSWASNSVGQSPCYVAALVNAPCNQDSTYLQHGSGLSLT